MIEPLLDRVVIRPTKQERSAGGIVLPDSSKADKNAPWRGCVVSVGPGKITKVGTREPMHVRPGDEVLFNPYGVNEVECEGDSVFILPEGDVLAILR